MTRDEALKQAGEIIIAHCGDIYGKIVFNLQGPRKSVHCNATERIGLQTDNGTEIDIDIEESIQL
jgi:hypothetical protein